MVREGYKQAEVGVIPEEWEPKSLGEMLQIGSGFSFKSEFFSATGPIVLTPGNFKLEGGLYFNDRNTKRYSGSFPESTIFQNGDLLVVMTDLTPDCNLLGKPAFVDSEEKILHNQRIGKLNLLTESLDKQFLYFLLLSPLYLQRIKEQATGSTVRHTSNKSIYSVVLPVPSEVEEQRAIATALSDVDALIAALDKLIAKKRHLKTAAMQQLLTGKKRLPGFGEGKGYKQTEVGVIPEDWDVIEVKDIVENNRLPSGIYKEKSLYGEGSKIIKISDVFNLDCFNPAEAQRVQIENDEIAKCKVNIGDIFIALASVKLEGVGKVMLVTELDEETAFDHNVALIRLNELGDPKFIFYLLKSNFVRNKIGKTATQVGTTFLKASTILAFQLPIPNVYEQRVIATVLSDMDAEIAALEARRAKTQVLKQGMMQELLTGNTRLV